AGRPQIQRMPDGSPRSDSQAYRYFDERALPDLPVTADYTSHRETIDGLADPAGRNESVGSLAAEAYGVSSPLPYRVGRSAPSAVVQRVAAPFAGNAGVPDSVVRPTPLPQSSPAVIQRQPTDKYAEQLAEKAAEAGIDLDRLATKVWSRVVR